MTTNEAFDELDAILTTFSEAQKISITAFYEISLELTDGKEKHFQTGQDLREWCEENLTRLED